MSRSLISIAIAAWCLAVTGTPGCSGSPEVKAARFLKRGREERARKDFRRSVLSFQNAIQARPDDPEPRYELGLTYLATGEPTSAALAFQAALRLSDTHIGAKKKLADLLVASADQETVREGAALARQVLTVQPDDADAQATIALGEMRMGNVAAAAKIASAGLKQHPGHKGLAINLARILSAQGDRTGTETVLKNAIQSSAEPLDLLLALGDLCLLNGSPAEAEEQYRRALGIDPGSLAGLLGLAKAQIASGRRGDAENTLQRLSAGADPRYRTAFARFLLEEGKRDSATAELEKITKREPGNRDAINLLIDTYVGAGATAKAEVLISKTLEAGKDNGVLLRRAALALDRGEVERAESDVRTVLNSADSADAHYLLSRVNRARLDPTSTASELKSALRADGAHLAARVALAELLTGEGKAREARALLDDAPAAQREAAPVLLQRNWALLAAGKVEEARASIARSRSPETTLQEAALELQQRRFSAAKVLAEKALAERPEDPRSLELLANVYIGLQQSDAAIQRIRDHVRQHSSAPALQPFLGHFLLTRGRLAEARVELQAVISRYPQLYSAVLDLAEVDEREGRLEEARARLKTLSHLDGGGAVSIRLAELEREEGHNSAAIELYKKALEKNPRHALVLNNLAYLLADSQGLLDEALAYAQQAKDLAPEDHAIDDTLGWIYYRKGLYPLAVRHLSRNGSFSNPRRDYHLAMAYYRVGEAEKGRATLLRALKSDPNLPEAAEAKSVVSEAQRPSAP
jgi:tetratricopeptide (TPR) repeat protein